MLERDEASQRCALPAGGWDGATCFDGTSLEARKLPENAASPTRRVHAVLGRIGLKMATMHVKGYDLWVESTCRFRSDVPLPPALPARDAK